MRKEAFHPQLFVSYISISFSFNIYLYYILQEFIWFHVIIFYLHLFYKQLLNL